MANNFLAFSTDCSTISTFETRQYLHDQHPCFNTDQQRYQRYRTRTNEHICKRETISVSFVYSICVHVHSSARLGVREGSEGANEGPPPKYFLTQSPARLPASTVLCLESATFPTQHISLLHLLARRKTPLTQDTRQIHVHWNPTVAQHQKTPPMVAF
jgi:hypothetical protein